MDLIPEPIIGIRQSVRSTIYKAALQPRTPDTFGIILGIENAEKNAPIFEAALVSCSSDELTKVKDIIISDISLCEKVVKFTMFQPIAIFTANSWSLRNDPNQRLGFLIDMAYILEIPYVAVFPTDGGETIWGITLYSSYRFPQEPLNYKMLKKASDKPENNPRRIRALWKKLKCGS
ncbi:MAG: hypothetical protein HQK62_14785 [Desulfamplus sp.]|nr:hypothetical protein [Desulfamplus sp.]